MKIRMFLTPMMLAAGLLCAATFQSSAQAPGGGGRGMGGGMLTQEQRTKLSESMQAAQAELAPLNEKLAAAQKDALKTALAKDADPKAVRAKIEAVTKIQVEIGMLRLKALKDIAPTLTDEQKTQMETRPGMLYNMLLGGFGGMGGPGGRRGGGGGGGNQ
ncbi:MAG: periplasmic heavy metal sensor [Verrucomicrobia bacterium]|nr:periplasmic heavy metal sensor [Verrucomicrobiota bacterium]